MGIRRKTGEASRRKSGRDLVTGGTEAAELAIPRAQKL